MKCYKCTGDLIEIAANCYDNISITSGNYIEVGHGYDGKTLSIKYCGHCGMVQHTFPLGINLPEVKAVTITKKDLLDQLMIYVKGGQYTEANGILKKLSLKITTREINELSMLLGNYIDIRLIQPEYPELDSYIKLLNY